MSREFQNRQRGTIYERAGARAVPNVETRTLIPQNESAGGGVVNRAGQQTGAVIRAPRGRYTNTLIVCDGSKSMALSENWNRCYLEIQNTSSNTVKVSFGNNIAFEVLAMSTWFSPVTPINEIFIEGPAGSRVIVVNADD